MFQILPLVLATLKYIIYINIITANITVILTVKFGNLGVNITCMEKKNL